MRLNLVVSFATALMVLAAPAGAQIFAGAATNPSVEMPGSMPVPPVQTLRFLPSATNGLRIIGEVGDLKWPVYLTAAQAQATRRLRLGYVSAVSVLPDSSFIDAKINDRSIGTDVIDAARGLRTVEFNIPAGSLQAGYNAVSVTVQQRHRVDCSVSATYELWTTIDPTETSLVMGADAGGVTDIADLAALLPKPDGALPIHVLLPGKLNPTQLQHLIRATQQIALAGHFLQPAVDFSAPTEDLYGVTLVVGTRDVLAHHPLLTDLADGAGPQVKIIPASAKGRPMLVITGSNDAEIDQALTMLGQTGARHGSSAGLDAIMHYPATPTLGGVSMTLRDLGVHSQEFAGRFFRKSVDVELPADFLASDYGRGTFDLAGGYAAGLERGSQVRVDVNGRSAGVIKLPFATGDVFQHNQLFLPLSLMRPGINHIDVMAETPRPEDAACAQSDSRRFLLLDRTALTLPVLAHVERLPDLGASAAGALPYTHGVAHLVVPKPDRETMSAALSLTARAAVAAGRVLAFQFSTTVSSDDDGSTLIVSPVRQLDPEMMTAVGLDPTAMKAAWRDVAASSLPDQRAISARWWKASPHGPSSCQLPMQASRAPASAVSALDTAPQASDGDDLLVAWAGPVVTTPAWSTRLMTNVTHAVTWVEDTARYVQSSSVSTDSVTIDSSLVLAQGMSPGSRDHVTTIVTAPNAWMLRASIACLLHPQVWPQVQGRMAVLNAATGDVTTIAATSVRYVASGRSSLSNSRLVIAGWFSLNPLAFAGLAVLTALCLSGTTLWFVRGVGRRPE